METQNKETQDKETQPREFYVERIGKEPFVQTLACLEQAIERAGMTIFARIDHAAAARDVGLAMPPTTVLVYGNPRGGTPVMLASPRAALDLPMRLLVREDADGRVLVGFHPIGRVLRDAGVADELAAKLEKANALVLQALD